MKNKDVGNIFVADKFEGLGTKDRILTVVWTDDKTIEILYPKDIRTFKLEKQFKTGKDNLKIDYKMTTEKTHIKK